MRKMKKLTDELNDLLYKYKTRLKPSVQECSIASIARSRLDAQKYIYSITNI